MTLQRPALGHTAHLGGLYDARSDAFVPLSIFEKSPPDEAMTITEIPNSDMKQYSGDSFKDKFCQMGIGPSLGASFLAGFFRVDGSGNWLNSDRDSNLTAVASLVYTVTTVKELINFQTPGIESCLALEVLESGMATHVVAEISWGSRNVVTVKKAVTRQQDAFVVSTRLRHDMTLLGDELSSGNDLAESNDRQGVDNSLEVTAFGDVNASDGNVPATLSGVPRYLRNVSNFLANTNNGKGKPVTYTLLSLLELSELVGCTSCPDLSVRNPSNACSDKLVGIFEEVAGVRRTLNDHRHMLLGHCHYVPNAQFEAVDDLVAETVAVETWLKSSYTSALKQIRLENGHEGSLWQIIDDFEKNGVSRQHVTNCELRLQRERMSLIQGLVNKGAKYIGFGGESIDLVISSAQEVDVYVLHLSDQARRNHEVWKQNISIANQLLDDRGNQSQIILKDCDALAEALPKLRIEYFRNADEIVHDVWEDRQGCFNRCTARYAKKYLDCSDASKPSSRIPIKMPCPDPSCSISAIHDWICAECNCQIEYGYVDQYIYCACGRCDFRHWAFRCSSRKHGIKYAMFRDEKFLGVLKALEPLEELNILILGRTGVGKSTWINAFTNYLTFPSLSEALGKDQELCWTIPFAFRTYNVTTDGEFEDVKVKVGFNEATNKPKGQKATVDEHDGTTGASATQKTAVHRVLINNRLIRLIDTPGIGDTRGASQDKENLADILSVLRSYQKIHGILILLKPNDQKLDVMFKFCIQELLTHLHRDAAKNIAFGFTNTRGTNYLPGDTFDPLRALLGRCEDVQITLKKHNVYCFDSESFRYLAAQKQCNQTLGHLQENSASWNYSVEESKRLIDYFQSLPPHEVTSTVNLYETRHRIVRLTEPMTAIADRIRSTISVNEDDIRELRQNKHRRKSLEKLLRIQINTLTAVKVEMPRTTCADASCVEYASTGIWGLDGKDVLKTRYKSPCHSPCYLQGIPLDSVGDERLRSCAAMMRTDNCQECFHPWNSHLHINYEVQEGTREINNPEIEEALQRNADLGTTREAGIANKNRVIEELQLELKAIEDAAAQFSVFLKRNAIIPYNDATIDYLDRLMDEERAKVAVGGSRDKLDGFSEYRKQYEQQVKALDEYMEKGEHKRLLDRAGVEEMLGRLDHLEHYGQNLRDMRRVIDSVEPEVHREKQFVRRANAHWAGEGKVDRVIDQEVDREVDREAARGVEAGVDGGAGRRVGRGAGQGADRAMVPRRQSIVAQPRKKEQGVVEKMMKSAARWISW